MKIVQRFVLSKLIYEELRELHNHYFLAPDKREIKKQILSKY